MGRNRDQNELELGACEMKIKEQEYSLDDSVGIR